MAIETNKDENINITDTVSSNTTGTGFSGSTLNSGGAPGGKLDFESWNARIGTKKIDSTIEPYLDKVMKLVKDNLPSASLVRLDRLNNCYAVKFDGPDGVQSFFGLYFVSPSDSVSPNFYPLSVRFKVMKDELVERAGSARIRISDARIVIAGYAGDMERAEEMANTIVSTLQVTSIPEFKTATIDVITSNEFVADWRLSEAKLAEQTFSPHGVRRRMDVGMTLKAKVRNELGREFREFGETHKLFGVIGGYCEIHNKEAFNINGKRVMLYQPVFNITVCDSFVSLPGAAAILLAAFAPNIYDSLFWATQWRELGSGNPNPGHLEVDRESHRPIELKDQDELKEFIETFFATPIIAFQFQDGGDNIPGLSRMVSPDATQRATLINNLTHFFKVPQENIQQELARQLDIRYEGAYGERDGTLHDSRNIDFLSIAAKNGVGSIHDDMRYILLGGSRDPIDRAKIVSDVTNGNFTPLMLTTTAGINPDFIRWIIQKADQNRLTITDPHTKNEGRPFGSIIDGFGSSSNIGSIVTSGTTNRGLNISSFWN